MNIPKYRLFRHCIQAWDREYGIGEIPERDTHIISIVVDYNGEIYSSDPKTIQPKALKFMVRAMKSAIIGLINRNAGKEVVTSIG